LTIKLASIVEGDGEVAALPVLLRRLNDWKTPGQWVQILPPARVSRAKFLNRPEEFSRHVQLAASKCGEQGWILILLDADDDCPADLGAQLARQAQAVAPHRRVSVVLANREYEAWFLAAAHSLAGHRGFSLKPGDVAALVDAESPRDAKGWMAQRIAGGGYRETTDQAAFSARMDLNEVFQASRSFRKLCTDWCAQVGRSSGLAQAEQP
jgi:predicted hotdog family 3-hydroxylacyl-ACP dehydratase